jgi:hypothetical protein
MIQRTYAFTVLLRYPGEIDTYLSHIYAPNPESAEDLAKKDLIATSGKYGLSIEDQDSIPVLAVFWGHHDDVQRTCRPVKEIKNEHP